MRIRRQQNFIDRDVQSFLIARLCVHWALLLIANGIGLFLWTRMLDSPEATLAESGRLFFKSFLPVLLISTAVLPVFVLDSFKLSNRIVGPISRFKKTLSTLAEGESAQPIEFRESDFWKSLARDFNKVLGLKYPSKVSEAKSS